MKNFFTKVIRRRLSRIYGEAFVETPDVSVLSTVSEERLNSAEQTWHVARVFKVSDLRGIAKKADMFAVSCPHCKAKAGEFCDAEQSTFNA